MLIAEAFRTQNSDDTLKRLSAGPALSPSSVDLACSGFDEKTMVKTASGDASENGTASQQIDAKIKALPDWRGAMLARVRHLIREADPEIIEEIKWRGVPVWSHAGIICTGEVYQQTVKLTFAKGASVTDPTGLFNASLDGNTRRAIDLHEGDEIDAQAFHALIAAAIAINTAKRRKPAAG